MKGGEGVQCGDGGGVDIKWGLFSTVTDRNETAGLQTLALTSLLFTVCFVLCFVDVFL